MMRFDASWYLCPIAVPCPPALLASARLQSIRAHEFTMNDAMHEFAPFQCGISPMGAVFVALPCPIPLGFNPARAPESPRE